MAYFYTYVYYGSSRNDGAKEPLLNEKDIPLSEMEADKDREEENEESVDTKESAQI